MEIEPRGPATIDLIERKPRLYGIEAGRGLAAIAVLMSHASAILAQPRFFGVPVWGDAFVKFGAGVDFFFVLSGFIIAWVHWGDIGRPDRVWRYARRRFRRIYPPYWGVLLPLALAYALFPAAGQPEQHDRVNLLFSVLLLPYPAQPVLGVAWTLVYEIVFYALFGLLIVTGRKMFWLLGSWGVAVMGANLILDQLAFPFTILLDVRNIQFLIGMAAAVWAARSRAAAPRLITAIGAALFVAQLLLRHPVLDDPLVCRLGFGIAAAVAIVGIVGWEKDRRLKVPTTLRALGAASYSIYLVHGIAISAVVHVLIHVLPRDIPVILPFCILVAAGILAGLVYHRVVERPLTRWIASRPRATTAADTHAEARRVG